MKKLILMAAGFGLFHVASANAVSIIRCQSRYDIQVAQGWDYLTVTLASSKQADVDHTQKDDKRPAASDLDQGTVKSPKADSKHPGYEKLSGAEADGSGKIAFSLPKEILDGADSNSFTGYFYSQEEDGGPDVPLMLTMTCATAATAAN